MMVPAVFSIAFFVGSLLQEADSFSLCRHGTGWQHPPSFVGSTTTRASFSVLRLSGEEEQDAADLVAIESLPEDKKKELVGNLVEDDEWNGVTMELSELVRT